MADKILYVFKGLSASLFYVSLDSKVTGITISMVLLTRQLSKESHLARTVQFFFNIVQKAFDPIPLPFGHLTNW